MEAAMTKIDASSTSFRAATQPKDTGPARRTRDTTGAAARQDSWLKNAYEALRAGVDP